MNERINELMPKPWTFPYPDRELYTKEQFEKFAELIVRECASELSRVPGGYDSSLFYKNSRLLKEHFGVKE